MLYLLRSFGKTKEDNLLKLGFTDDYKKRLFQYKVTNPRIEEVSTRDGDIIDETKFHLYLRHLGYLSYGDEWYKDDPEVIRIFKEISMSDIDKYIWKNRDSVFKKCGLFSKRTGMEKIYTDLLHTVGELDVQSSVIDKQYFLVSEKQRVGEIMEKVLNTPENLLTNVDKFLLKFNGLKTFYDKMKLLCEESFTDVEISTVLDQIPLSYKNYYNALGPENLRAVGYNQTLADARLRVQNFDQKRMDNDIYHSFKEGERYTRTYIKNILGDIYIKNGYGAVPKAKDIEKWFDVSICRLPSETAGGKREPGFKIIKKKS